MLPLNVNLEPITIMTLDRNKIKRKVVRGLWFDSVAKAIHSQGSLSLDLVTVYIFDFQGYSSSTLTSENQWTINMKDTYIFRGNYNYDLKLTDSSTQSEANDAKRAFDNLYRNVYKKPKAVQDNRKGPKSQQHLVIVCQ